MKKKLFIPFIVLFTVLIAFCAINVSAATYENLTYSAFNGEATVMDCDDSSSGELVIPDTLGGYPVTRIGSSAFSSCSSLVSITIPDSVTSIGDYAFYYCRSLSSITIPDSVTSIGERAFYYCSNLEKVDISDISAWCKIKFEGNYANPLYCAKNLYLNGNLVTNLVIPDDVTSIGADTFYYCDSLTSITIPDSVTSIGYGAFSYCCSLTSIAIPDSVTSISNSAFSYCRSLTSITIPDSVTSIGDYAFYSCSSLKRVDISDLSAWCKIKFEDNYANPLWCAQNLYLNGNLVVNLVIPDDVTCIGDYAFYNCNSLSSVTITDNVTSIGRYAFSACSNLASVTIPDNVTSIGDSAFDSCSSLTSITIPDSVTSIGDSAFSSCRSLASIIIPDSVTSIGECAFSTCSSLTSITIPDSVTSIGSYMFSSCNSLSSVTITDNVTSIGRYAFSSCDNLTSITIPDSVTSIGDYAFYSCGNLTSITIPDSVTSIGEWVFSTCSNLTSITIPNSVTSIGECAFSSCRSLASIIIPDSVTNIGDGAFDSCSNLASITIPDSVTSIGERAFYYCSNLKTITIGNGTEVIPERAFYNSYNLKYVAIPAEIKYIRNDAFNGCSKIEMVFYCGSESEWNEILFYNRNINLTNAKIVYNAAKRNYKFETNCSTNLSDITDYAIFTMPDVKNDDKTLTGWYDNEALSGEPVTFPYYGDATTLYAAWTDRTGKSFEDAFTAKENCEYTVTTIENRQLVYFEFVPKQSGKYYFYTKGSKDTYGNLYNSKHTHILSDDNGGEGNNFHISYNLTAGQTYYIVAGIYSGMGTFAFVVEKPGDYRINELTIKDMSENSLQAIPTGTFFATISLTNVSSENDTVIMLAQYTSSGAFGGIIYMQVEDIPIGSTIKLSVPVDNSKGNVSELKAFCWDSFGSLKPMGNSASFPLQQ